MMDQWPSPPLGDNQSDPEDEDAGYHSDDLLEEMDVDDLNLSLYFQMQSGNRFVKGLEEIGRAESFTGELLYMELPYYIWTFGIYTQI